MAQENLDVHRGKLPTTTGVMATSPARPRSPLAPPADSEHRRIFVETVSYGSTRAGGEFSSFHSPDRGLEKERSRATDSWRSSGNRGLDRLGG